MSIPTVHWQGLVHRAHNPLWSYTPTSGTGAAHHGGRFNRKGKLALYTSLDPKTVWMEGQQGFPFKPQPMTLVSYEVDCEDIVDLTDPRVQSAARTSASDLACPWEDLASRNIDPPTWTLSDSLISTGVAGIIVRSFAPGCGPEEFNLVFWSWSGKKPYRIITIDDHERLPKPPGSASVLISATSEPEPLGFL